jgi:catechol 2,3-dioxygenase-like lactoylglutathione lyase family enzyme
MPADQQRGDGDGGAVAVLTGFDHATIVVRDVDAAVRSYERLLGAPPVWRGRHPELGSAGALFGLSNAVIELVGPREGAPEADGLRALLDAQGEQLQAIAFRTADAGACSATLRQRGVRATPPQEGEAQADDGSVRRYRTVDLSPRATRGLSVLAVERPGELPGAPGGDVALDHVVLRTAQPDAAVALYGRDLGLRLALDRAFGATRMLFFRIGGVTLEVVEQASAGEKDAFGGLAYRVGDIEATNARLRAEGLNVSEVRDGAKPGTRVFTVRDGTCGVPTLILRDPSRERAPR